MSSGNIEIGAICVILSAILWGSNYSIVKNYDVKDGMHFQFLLCLGVFLVGVVCMLVSSPQNRPPSDDNDAKWYIPELSVNVSLEGALAGCTWCVGNLMTVQIIKRIGLGMGFSIWAGTSLLLSYFIGRMALLGLESEPLSRPKAGDFGVVLGILSLLAFCQIDPEHSDNEYNPTPHQKTSFIAEDLDLAEPLFNSDSEKGNSGFDNLDKKQVAYLRQRRINKYVGISLAILAGVAYGFQFVPAQVHNQTIRRNLPPGMKFDEKLESIRFFFSQYLGTFFCSSIVYLGYNVKKKLKHKEVKGVSSEIWMWSVISGIMWACGCLCAMLATSTLGLTVGFPLSSNGCFLINNAWSYFYFKEISLPQNKFWFALAIVLNLSSCVFLTVSKA